MSDIELGLIGNVLPAKGDPWANRAMGMRCVSCMWWMQKGSPDSKVGRCRRRAPTMNGYPVVFDGDWCGDHKLNEDA